MLRGFDSCDIAFIYVYVLYYGKKQRNIVQGTYEMHYFKLTAVRNLYIPHFSLPFGIRRTLFNNFPTEVRDTYDPSTPEFPF